MLSTAEKAVLVLSIVLMLSGAGISVLFMARETSRDRDGPDLTSISSELRSMVMDRLRSDHSASTDRLSAQIDEDIRSYIASDLARSEGSSIIARSVEVSIREDLLPIASAYPPETLLTKRGLLYPNSELSGSAGPLPALPVLKADIAIEMEIRPEDGGEAAPGSIRFEVLSMDPDRTLRSLMSLIGSDMDGWGSGMARDMEYMLNSLVRMRTVRLGVGTRPFDTALNILNEGDVEIAYNIAMGLSIARWTGKPPSDLLSNIERFYSEQTLGTTMNPTGSRIWGEAERDTFATYRERTASAGAPRSIAALTGSVVQTGHSDTADIFLRYLHLDARTSTSERLDPLDDKSPLEEMDLLNSRQRKDAIDTYSLEHHPSYPTGSGIPLPQGTVPSGSGTDGGPLLIADIGPTRGYSVAGRDMRVAGLNDYRAWFTNADPSLNETDLINYGYSGQTNTRCGAILPPPEPPSHDYRIQWDLVVTAMLNLTGTVQGYVGNSLPEGPVTFEMPISFPIRVHSWFLKEPNRDGGIRLANLNTGLQEYTPLSTRWVITAKANATEYFERYAFQDIREGISIGSSLLRSLSYRERLLDPSGARTSAQVNALSSVQALQTWVNKRELGRDLAILNQVYLKGKGLKPGSLGTLDTDGLSMTLDYYQAKDRMDITVRSPEGSIVLSVLPISSPAPEAVLKVTTPGGIEVTVEPSKGSFKIEGSLNGLYFKEGALSPTIPTEAMRSMILEDRAIMTSAPFTFYSSRPSSPYEPYRSGMGEVLLAPPTVHLALAGPRSEIDDLSMDLPAVVGPGTDKENGPDIFFTDLLARTSGTALWAGVVVVWNGENGTTPLVRTMLFRASNGADPSFIRASILQAIWSPYPDLEMVLRGQDQGSIEVMTYDRMPSWAVPPGPSAEGTDVIISAHYRFEPGANGNVLDINVFQQSSMDAPNYGMAMFDWTVIEQKAASPLW
ncbi:MAG: hypothetical protein MUC62_00070 [Candidatus Thermoplasmatota archaeon]|jgi:hypothetical protein|nr:hypothetical protein [Candidatus Thermoplasmatota archaeon]